MVADIGLSFTVEQTILAAMRCHAISEETTRAYHKMPSPVCRTIMSAVTETIATNDLSPKNLTQTARLFTASVEVAQKRLGV